MKFALSGSFNPLGHLPDMARTAEECGWAMFTLGDHVVHLKEISSPHPYSKSQQNTLPWSPTTEWPDTWVAFGALAAVTKRIVFASSVFVLPLRNPFVVAKQVSTAAAISNNRIVLAVGLGWSKDEFEVMGQNFHDRGKRCDEMIEILCRLWKGGWAQFSGQHYRFGPVQMSPLPSAQIPIWTAGISDSALQRAARLADGWAAPNQTVEDTIACSLKINEYRKAFGRDHVRFDISAGPTDACGPADYRRLAEAGVTYVRVRPWLANAEIANRASKNSSISLDDKLASIRRFGEEVIAKC